MNLPNFDFANMKLGPDEMKQAEHIWKMLDDMSETNPEGYKNFIKTQVESGMENAKKEKEKEIKALGTKPKIGYLLRMNAKLNKINANNEETNENYSKFLIKKDAGEAEVSVPETVRLYLNVCHSEKVLKPLTTTGAICTNVEDPRTWHNIPVSIPEFVTSKNQYDDTTTYYFIAIINEEFYNVLQQKKGPIMQSFQNYMLEKLQHRLKTDRNPIKNYNKSEFKYYKIEPNSITNRKKKFKVKGLSEPKEYLLDFDADTEFFQKRQKMMQEKKEVRTSPLDQPAPDIKISPTPQQTKPVAAKAPLIEEIGGTNNEETKLPDYNLQEQQDKYIIEIKLDEEDLAGSFELDASEYCIKLQMDFRKPLVISLSRQISKDDVKATLKKKKKLLIIEALKC